MANSTPRRNRLTVYIGRFQPFHKGHVNILEQAMESASREFNGAVLVLVGSAHIARNIKNPFTYEERRAMIRAWVIANYPVGTRMPYVEPIRDQSYNHAKWFQTVQEIVENTIADLGWKQSETDVAITGSDRDESTWYLKSFPQFLNDLKPAVPPGKDLSATKLRHRLFGEGYYDNSANKWNDVPGTTWAFLRNFMETAEYSTLREEYDFNIEYKKQFSSLKYEPTFVTADSVIIQSGHVLVVQRGALPGKGLWALPGGFVKSHQTLLQAAICEVIEETGLKLADGKKAKEITESILTGSVRAKENFDDPNRSLRGRTFTTAFLFRLDDSKPLPTVKGQFAPLEDTDGVEGIVETADAFWLPISVARANSDKWFEDHHAILDVMLGMIKD